MGLTLNITFFCFTHFTRPVQIGHKLKENNKPHSHASGSVAMKIKNLVPPSICRPRSNYSMH